MKEFPLSLREYHKGLRPSDRDSRNRGFCTRLDNARVDADGISDFETIVSPFGDTDFYDEGLTTDDFPFPQLLKGKSKTFLCTKYFLYEVTRGAIGSWSFSKLDTYDAYSVGSSKAITAGSFWQLIDLFDSWMLVNDSCTIFKLADNDNLYGFSGKVLVEDAVTIKAGVEHQGRVVLGGFDSTNFWNAEWKEFWNKWLNEQVDRSSSNLSLGSNFILWTMVGAADLLWTFYPSIAQSGVISDSPYGASEPLLFEQLKRGDSGFMPMSWQGSVLAIRELGGRLVVYGSDGISLLTPILDPMPTYGEQVISNVGITSAGAVAGDKSLHMFVDKKGCLWRISDQGPQRLGYEEYLSELTDPVVNFNENDSEFYISDGEQCYVFNRGLSKWWQVVHSAFYDSGQVVGVVRHMNTLDAGEIPGGGDPGGGLPD